MSSSKLFIFGLVISALISSCVNHVEPSRVQIVHIYSDVIGPKDDNLFHDFEREAKIDVRIHKMSFDSIFRLLYTKRYSTNIDMVLFKEPRHLGLLQQTNLLYAPKSDPEEYWQPVAIDPLIFKYASDSSQNFLTYGQIARSDKGILVPSDELRSTYLSEILTHLSKIYPKYSQSAWQEKVRLTDTIYPKGIQMINWSFHSELKSTDFRYSMYPDQGFYGAVGKETGIAIIQNNPNLTNSILLHEYCRRELWRKKLADRLGIFGLLSYEENRDRYPFIAQPETRTVKK